MRDICALIQAKVKPIQAEINPVYFTLCCNKLVAATAA